MVNYWVVPGLDSVKREIPIDRVFACIEKVTGIRRMMIESKNRSWDVGDARKLFILIMRNVAKKTTTETGRLINRDHSTIVYSQIECNKLLEFNKDFARMYDQVKSMVLNPYSL